MGRWALVLAVAFLAEGSPGCSSKRGNTGETQAPGAAAAGGASGKGGGTSSNGAGGAGSSSAAQRDASPASIDRDAALPGVSTDASGAALGDAQAVNGGLPHGFCLDSGFCWVDPLPQGRSLYGVWASGRQMWTVGELGTILHWDGSAWSLVPSGVRDSLRAIWGSSPDDLWACGEGILHFDGARWTQALPASQVSCLAVAGSSASDVWMAGVSPLGGGGAWHYDGNTLSQVASAPTYLRTIWSSGANDVWAGGDAATPGFFHFDGGSWSAVVPGFTVTDLWGASAKDVWAVGGTDKNLRTTFHFDGVAWTEKPIAAMVDASSAQPGGMRVWGAASNDVYAASDEPTMYHWDGSAWSNPGATLPNAINDLWGGDAQTVWGVGGLGLVVQGSLASFTTMSSKLDLPGGARQVWGSDAQDVWVQGSQGDLQHWNGSGWKLEGGAVGTARIAGSSASDLWAGPGYFGFRHFDGSTWKMLPQPANSISDLWVASASDAWCVTSTGAFHWDGTQWTNAFPATDGKNIWGSAPNDVWFGGGAAKLQRWNGSAWAALDRPLPQAAVKFITGTSDKDVWLIIGDTTRTHSFRWDGSTWLAADVANGSGLTMIWAESPTNAYGASADGAFHWDGAAWTSMGSGMPDTTWIWGSGAHDVWAVSGYRLLHHD